MQHLAQLALMMHTTSTAAQLMWMRNSSGILSVTYGEAPGAPESAALLHTVSNKTDVWMEVRGKRTLLQLKKQPAGEEGAALVTTIAQEPPYMLKLTTVVGKPQAGAPFLIYRAFAPAVTRPEDWRGLDGFESSDGISGLEITLRDPFMIGGVPGEGVLSPPLPAAASPPD